MGDNLNDEQFAFSDSDNELTGNAISSVFTEDGGNAVEITSLTSTSTKTNKKRKADKDGSEMSSSGENAENSNSKNEKKKKKKKKARDLGKMSNAQLLIEEGREIATRDLPIQAAYLKSLCALYPPAASDSKPLQFSGLNILATSQSQFSAQAHTDENLPTFLKITWPGDKGTGSRAKQLKRFNNPYTPMYIIVCTSAVRCCEILKCISPMKIRVAKLFAKNMKEDQQRQMLKSGDCPIAVGTAGRVLKLCSRGGDCDDDDDDGGGGALQFDENSVLLVDCSLDKKGFNALTMRDCQRDLVSLISIALEGGAKLSLY